MSGTSEEMSAVRSTNDGIAPEGLEKPEHIHPLIALSELQLLDPAIDHRTVFRQEGDRRTGKVLRDGLLEFGDRTGESAA